MMKALYTFVTICSILQFLSFNASAQDVKSHEQQFNIMFQNLDSLITNSPEQNQTVKSYFDVVKQKIFDNQLSIFFDSTLAYNFREISSFDLPVSGGDPPAIGFGRFLIDKYHNHPALVYAAMISSMSQAYQYFTQKDLFLVSKNNNIEATFYALDALIAEALFLKTYIKDKNTLGHFEKYLLADLNSGLAGSSILFYQTDLGLLHEMDDISYKDKSEKELIIEFNELGQKLIKTTVFDDKESKWANYCALSKLITFVYYGRQAVYAIIARKSNMSPEAFDMQYYPEIQKTIDTLKDLANANTKYLSNRDEIIHSMNESYK